MKNYLLLLSIIYLSYISPTFGQWVKIPIDPSLPNATFMDVGDIDNDGKPDIAANGSPYTKWYKYDSINETWEIYPIDSTLYGAVGLAIVDVDGDSSLDIVTSGYISNDIRWYKNEGGSPISWRRYFIDDNFIGAEFLSAGDIDGDNDPDIVITTSSGNSVAWYENNMPDTNWSKHYIDNGSLPGAIVCDIGDLDSDGDLDVAATGIFSHDLVWYRNNFPDHNWTKEMVDGNLPGAFGVKIGDIDGNDSLDIVATSSSGHYVAWYKNTNVGQTLVKSIINTSSFNGAALIDIADMDLDGDNDIVATADEANDVVWFVNHLPSNWASLDIDGDLPGALGVCTANILSDDTLDVIAAGRLLNILVIYTIIVDVELLSDMPPTEYKLTQNYPNPFNPTTKIKYSVPQLSDITIKVFDILGNEIEMLVNTEKPAGTYEITWYAEVLPSGIYFYQIKAGDFIQAKKMVLMK